MSDKLSLQWTDFKENVNSAFGRLRDDKEFSDVTLACEDGQQMEAHKVILAASSPFFENIFQRSKHPHPLIYLRGFQSQDLVTILDFLYFGEANVFQENLDSFLEVADELKLKGLTRQITSDLMEPVNPEPMLETKEPFRTRTTYNNEARGKAIPKQFSGDLQALDEYVKSMMERSLNMIPKGKQANGTPKQASAYICKVCGKEGLSHHIMDHIEVNHLEGMPIPCGYCDKAFSTRKSLVKHKAKYHK